MAKKPDSQKKEELLLFHSILVISITLGIFCLLVYSKRWDLFAIPHLNGMFLDMFAVTAAIEGHADGINVLISNPYDPFDRIHIYSPLWLLGSHFGIGRPDTYWISPLTIIVYLSLTVYLVRPKSLVASFLTLAFLLSPSILLIMERANNDIVAYCLIVLATLLAAKDRPLHHYASSACLLVASLAKFYPFFALGLFLVYFIAKRQWKVSIIYFTSIVIFFGYIFGNYEEIRLIIGNIPNVTNSFTFGGETLFHRIGIDLNIWTRIATYLGFISSLALAFLCARKFKIQWAFSNTLVSYSYFIGVGMLLFCFVVGNSFDYRNVYGLMMLPLFINWILSEPDRSTANKPVAIICVLGYAYTIWACWFAYKSGTISERSSAYLIIESSIMWIITLPLLMVMWSFLLDVFYHSKWFTPEKAPDHPC